MKIPRILILFVLVLLSGSVSPQSKSDLIEELISKLHREHLFNGAIVVGEKGKIIFSKGYGYANFHDSLHFTPFTASDGGSNAKTFTAASILLLAEEGKLKLNDVIQKYLPEYPYPNTTVWNFITHSIGGLPDYDYFFQRAVDTAIVSTELNLNIIAKEKPSLIYSPGSNFYYDNVGFDLAALVVERVSGMSYQQFLKKRIFDPLRMNSSFVRPALFKQWMPARTIGYRYQNDSLRLFDIADREGFYGGCNIWFSAFDLYHWGESFYHRPVLSPSLIKQITSPVSIDGKQSHVKLGAWYAGKSKDAFYYWGNVAGFYSWVYWDKNKQFTIAFMTNTAMPQWARPLFTSALISIMEATLYLPIIEPKADLINRSNLHQVVGKYAIDKIGKVDILVRGKAVILKLSSGMEYHMHLVDKRTFYIPGYDPWISFNSLKGNRFQNISWSSTILNTKGKRLSD
jgi:CubicO group peptidase (beta-lactamase class C family)